MGEHLRKCFLLSMFMFYQLLTAATNLVFLGLVGSESPAITKTIEKNIREKISMSQNISLTDYKETLRFVRESEFEIYSLPSERIFILLKEKFGDSNFVVWGYVRYLHFTMERKMLVKAAVKGELKISLYIYKTSSDTIVYNEDIISSVKKGRGFIFFSSPNEAIPLSATEKEQLTEELIESAVEKIVSSISKSTSHTELKDSNIVNVDSVEKK